LKLDLTGFLSELFLINFFVERPFEVEETAGVVPSQLVLVAFVLFVYISVFVAVGLHVLVAPLLGLDILPKVVLDHYAINR